MATEEARTLLNSLMGGDRNAALPAGAAVPLSKKQRLKNQNDGTGSSLLLPGRRSKSCYDKDIDPLYTAWGVDVYELFVNTKSDIGTNPYVVDRGAHEEFQKLPAKEQETLGFYHFLFQKLSELVRQCDRIVTRNKEKLRQEVQRKLSQRGGQDFVETVDEGAVDHLAMDLWHLEQLQIKLHEKYLALNQVVQEEEEKKQELDEILRSKQDQQEQSEGGTKTEDTVKKEEGAETASNTPETRKEESKQETQATKEEPTDEKKRKRDSEEENSFSDLQVELGRITMQKQQMLFDMANIISRLSPLQEAVIQQHRNLNYVKSDISTDKTVCEVSGNFMSSRDADERIAAHYAGKQYVGWKLVRDKHQEMIQKFGRYGPPPPSNPPGGGRPGGFDMDPRGGGRDHGGGRGRFPPGNRGGGYGGDRGGGNWGRGGGGGGGDYHRRGPPPRGGGGGGWRR